MKAVIIFSSHYFSTFDEREMNVLIRCMANCMYTDSRVRNNESFLFSFNQEYATTIF